MHRANRQRREGFLNFGNEFGCHAHGSAWACPGIESAVAGLKPREGRQSLAPGASRGTTVSPPDSKAPVRGRHISFMHVGTIPQFGVSPPIGGFEIRGRSQSPRLAPGARGLPPLTGLKTAVHVRSRDGHRQDLAVASSQEFPDTLTQSRGRGTQRSETGRTTEGESFTALAKQTRAARKGARRKRASKRLSRIRRR